MAARCCLKGHQWFIATVSSPVWDMLVLYTAGHGYTQPLLKLGTVVPSPFVLSFLRFFQLLKVDYGQHSAMTF